MMLLCGGKVNSISFERHIEKITFSGALAIVMGHEVVRPYKSTRNAGKTVTRRYTDGQVRQAGTSYLVARQATNVEVH
jgi:hypothetical protein